MFQEGRETAGDIKNESCNEFFKCFPGIEMEFSYFTYADKNEIKFSKPTFDNPIPLTASVYLLNSNPLKFKIESLESEFGPNQNPQKILNKILRMKELNKP